MSLADFMNILGANPPEKRTTPNADELRAQLYSQLQNQPPYKPQGLLGDMVTGNPWANTLMGGLADLTKINLMGSRHPGMRAYAANLPSREQEQAAKKQEYMQEQEKKHAHTMMMHNLIQQAEKDRLKRAHEALELHQDEKKIGLMEKKLKGEAAPSVSQEALHNAFPGQEVVNLNTLPKGVAKDYHKQMREELTGLDAVEKNADTLSRMADIAHEYPEVASSFGGFLNAYQKNSTGVNEYFANMILHNKYPGLRGALQEMDALSKELVVGSLGKLNARGNVFLEKLLKDATASGKWEPKLIAQTAATMKQVAKEAKSRKKALQIGIQNNIYPFPVEHADEEVTDSKATKIASPDYIANRWAAITNKSQKGK